MSPRQRGIALVLVLWVLMLITIASSAFALMARTDRLESHTLMHGVKARLAAQSAIHVAALNLRDPDELTRWQADGRIYAFEFDGALVELAITDERGKLDINVVDEGVMQQLLMGHGVDQVEAELIAAAVMDWRDGDDIERVNGAEADSYYAAGLPMVPANRPFIMVEELLQVAGMSWALYKRLEPGITVWSRTANPEPAFAPLEALLALPDLTAEEAADFIVQRQAMPPGEMAGMALPGGQPFMARGRGVTYSIEARATLPNGIWDQVEATIRLGGTREGQPFRILRWNEGFRQ
ncbi:MAG: type II secretion system protein GspK [Xanthomonadales bacterium]|nr:type II secretion system protein GspK [Xanthomonadales bacterium]